MSAEEIAEKLQIIGKTVNFHRYHIVEKLVVKNNVELVKLAMQYKVIEIERT